MVVLSIHFALQMRLLILCISTLRNGKSKQTSFVDHIFLFPSAAFNALTLLATQKFLIRFEVRQILLMEFIVDGCKQKQFLYLKKKKRAL